MERNIKTLKKKKILITEYLSGVLSNYDETINEFTSSTNGRSDNFRRSDILSSDDQVTASLGDRFCFHMRFILLSFDCKRVKLSKSVANYGQEYTVR